MSLVTTLACKARDGDSEHPGRRGDEYATLAA